MKRQGKFVRFTRTEIDTVLAALRYWQMELESAEGMPGDFVDIACEHGKPLTASQIDKLCESINQ